MTGAERQDSTTDGLLRGLLEHGSRYLGELIGEVIKLVDHAY